MKYSSNTQSNSYSHDYNNNSNNYNNFKNNTTTTNNRNQGTTLNTNRNNSNNINNNTSGSTNNNNNNMYGNQAQRQNFQQQYYNTTNPSNTSVTKQYSQNDNYNNGNNQQRMNNNRAKPSLSHTSSLDHSYPYYNNQYHNSHNFNQPTTPPFLAQPTGTIPPSVQTRHHANYFHHPNNGNSFNNNKAPYNLSHSSGNNQFNLQPVPHQQQHSVSMGMASQINIKSSSGASNHFKAQPPQPNSFPVPNPSSPVSPGGPSSTSAYKDSSNNSQENVSNNNMTNPIPSKDPVSGGSNQSLSEKDYAESQEENKTLVNRESNEKTSLSADENSQLESPSSPHKSSNSNREEDSDEENDDDGDDDDDDDELNVKSSVSVRSPSPIDDYLDSRYPLHSTWTFWYFKHDTTSKDWESNLKPLMDVAFVDEFWSVFNTLFSSEGFMKHSDFMLFKKGTLPMWEDENNKNGGSWLYHMNQQQHNKNGHHDVINKNIDPMYNSWIHTLLEMIGDNFCGDDNETTSPVEQKSSNQSEDHICDYISGAYLNNRKAKKISLWTKDYKNEKMTRRIGRKWKSLLKLSEYVTITFEVIFNFKLISFNIFYLIF